MKPRTRDASPGLLQLLIIAASILLLFGWLHPAHAQPATIGIAPPANPLPDLTAAGGTAWDTFAANGLGWGAVAVVAALLHTFVSRQHWLTQGRTLAILTGAAGILVAVANWHFAGAPAAGILTAALVAVALVKKPTVPGAASSTGPIPTIGSSGGTGLRGSVGAAILVCIAVAGAATATACGGDQASRAATMTSIDTWLVTARAAVRTYELDHAQAIIETTPDKPARAAPLGVLRAKVDKVIFAIDTATYALDAARTVNDDTSIKGAQTALSNALAAVAALTGGAP